LQINLTFAPATQRPACPACPVKREAGLSGVKSLLPLFLWGEVIEIQRLFNRDGIFVAFIPSG